MIKEILIDDEFREFASTFGFIMPFAVLFCAGLFGSKSGGIEVVCFFAFFGLAFALLGVFGNYLYQKQYPDYSKKSTFVNVFEGKYLAYQALLLNFIVIAWLMEITLHSFNGIVITVLAFVMMELVFWFFLYKKPKPGENKYSFAFVQKMYALFIGGGLIGAFITFFNVTRSLMIHGQKTLNILIAIGLVITTIATIVGTIWLFIWSNTLKYSDVPNEKPVEQITKVIKQARKNKQKKKTTTKKTTAKKVVAKNKTKKKKTRGKKK